MEGRRRDMGRRRMRDGGAAGLVVMELEDRDEEVID